MLSRDVTSGVPRMACCIKFSIATCVYMGTKPYVQTTAPSCIGEIPSCLDTDLELSALAFSTVVHVHVV